MKSKHPFNWTCFTSNLLEHKVKERVFKWTKKKPENYIKQIKTSSKEPLENPECKQNVSISKSLDDFLWIIMYALILLISHFSPFNLFTIETNKAAVCWVFQCISLWNRFSFFQVLELIENNLLFFFFFVFFTLVFSSVLCIVVLWPSITHV